MDEDKKRILLIAGGAIILVVLAVGVYFAFRSNAANKNVATVPMEKQNVTPGAPNQPVVENSAPTNNNTTLTPPTDSVEDQLKRVALDFVSRFGTYSTDAPNANIVQLRPAMGPQLAAWADARIQKPPIAYVKFESVTTKALAAQIISKTSSKAELKVSTQRMFSNKTPAVQYQTADVALVLVKGIWLVDAVTWNDQK